MTIALVDNGSLAAAAHRHLRALAAALSERTGAHVHTVSWKHSNRVPTAALDDAPAWTLTPWVRAQLARGEREFVFVPFFVSAQGAIGSALRRELEQLQRDVGEFEFAFSDGLAARGVLGHTVAELVRATLATNNLLRPSVIVVDHGGPSAESAALRDEIAGEVRTFLGPAIGPLAAASMEGAHGPLFPDQLAAPGFGHGNVVIAPLFLSPGRHAGAGGDLAQMARAAEERPAALRCHFTALLGTHPGVVATLTAALREALASFPVPLPA